MNKPRLDFIVGGAPRSGTTFLATALDRHPDIWMIKPYAPEPKIFILPKEKTADEYRQDIARLAAQAPEGKLVGEKTTSYLSSDYAPRRIAATLPSVKVVFLLREPSARAYSNYLWSRKNGWETLSFEEACAAEDSRPNPLPPEKSYTRPFDYLNRGRYGTYARRWLEALGQKRVLFLLMEHLETDPEAFFARLERFLGAAPFPLHNLGLGRINISEAEPAPLQPAMRERLKRHFAEEVALFSRTTGEDVSLWKY